MPMDDAPKFHDFPIYFPHVSVSAIQGDIPSICRHSLFIQKLPQILRASPWVPPSGQPVSAALNGFGGFLGDVGNLHAGGPPNVNVCCFINPFKYSCIMFYHIISCYIPPWTLIIKVRNNFSYLGVSGQILCFLQTTRITLPCQVSRCWNRWPWQQTSCICFHYLRLSDSEQHGVSFKGTTCILTINMNPHIYFIGLDNLPKVIHMSWTFASKKNTPNMKKWGFV